MALVYIVVTKVTARWCVLIGRQVAIRNLGVFECGRSEHETNSDPSGIVYPLIFKNDNQVK